MKHGSFDHPVRPDGYRKPKSRVKASRSPIYIPVPTEAKRERAQWLGAR